MSGLNSYEGNSVIAAHCQEEARKERGMIEESDEGGILPECNACGEHTVEQVYSCKATNTLCTTYCIAKGMRGCLYKITGRCLGFKAESVCSRCGEIN